MEKRVSRRGDAENGNENPTKISFTRAGITHSRYSEKSTLEHRTNQNVANINEYKIILGEKLGMTITIRNCQERDVDAVRQFIHTIENLDYHTPFSYWVLFKYFAGLCFILEKDGEIIGFISGVIDEGGKIFYVWQLAIAPAYRGQNLGGLLFEKAIKVAIEKECHVLQVSIAPDNYQSFSAISKAVDKNGLEIKKVGQVDFCDSLSNYHQWENLYEVSF